MASDRVDQSFFEYELVQSVPAENGEACRFYRRRTKRASPDRTISESDLRECAVVAGAVLAARLPFHEVPRRYAGLVSHLRAGRKHQKWFGGFSAGIQAVLGQMEPRQIQSVFDAYVEQHVRRRQVVALDHAGRIDRSNIRLSGSQALQEALSKGRGAIVWASQFAHQTLIGKRCLHEHGFEPIQVSVGQHGFSSTRFGAATINRWLIEAENRYLKDRLVFERAQGASLVRLVTHLLDNGALIILTNNIFSGSIFVELRFGRSGYISMPTTALSLAVRRATPLFCLTTLETQPLFGFQSRLTPISVGHRPNERRATRDYSAMAELALQARNHILDGFTAAPEQWLLPSTQATSVFAKI